MKKLFTAALMCLLLLSITSTAKAVVILPGGSAVPIGAPSPGGALLTSIIGVPFSGTDVFSNVIFTGTLSHWVRSNGTGVLFEYQFSNNPTSLDAIARLSTTDYTNYMTDVDATGLGVAPFSLSRSFAGSTVSFTFTGVLPGTTSNLLWIQTDAPSFRPGSTVLLNGGRAAVATFSPVPEPASMLLLGMGILGVFGLGLRKKA